MQFKGVDLKHLVFACRVQGWQGEDLELFLTHDQDLEDIVPGTWYSTLCGREPSASQSADTFAPRASST